ncbi:exocyst complex component Sec10-domain-containing protein [Peziza echinospora]|nr:exocyst complex component Sec10-domain-containing protein [Peziza echinospora]
MPPQPIRRDIMASLHATTMVYNGKPVFPLEIMARILDHLPVSSLLTFARVSHQLKDMVYDDTRWVHKLRAMGVWNETEARRRYDEAIAARKRELQRQREAASPVVGGAAGLGAPPVARLGNMTLFDAGEEERRHRQLRLDEEKRRQEMENRRNTMAFPPPPGTPFGNSDSLIGLSTPVYSDTPKRIFPADDPEATMKVLSNIVSSRGFARQEFGKIYGALAPFYLDLAKARTHTDPILFRLFREPEHQAIMLAQLKIFSRADESQGWRDRLDRLESITSIFENAALREFEGGYEAQDIDGRMKRYAQVLIHLNGGLACIQLFVQKHPIMFERERLGNPMDCFDSQVPGSFSLDPSLEFFGRLSGLLNDQANVIDRVFPDTVNVMVPFLERVAEDVIGEYITPVFDEAHDRDIEMYLKAVGGIFQHVRQFSDSITRPHGSGGEDDFRHEVWRIMARVFEPHVDLYLQEELDYFKKKAQGEVDEWGKKVNEADVAIESQFMSTVNREDKRDFLSTFKKVILMPVQAIPLTPFGIKSAPKPAAEPVSLAAPDTATGLPSRSNTPAVGDEKNPSPAVPTTELAAKAAIMNSRLEGIRSLFSLEVALKLVHLAKASLERAALFAKVEGQTGEEAKEQCEALFIALLQVLGPSHIRTGFDKALDHLSAYNPRDVTHNSLGVAPLVTFLELVNVGDLIQQMIDVFYEQELVAAKLTDKNDFLNPAAKEKKRFEQMLDERVAAGLNRGIDVLIDEVDYLFATTQQPTDFNPGAIVAMSLPPRDFDIGPTPTAARIVTTVSSHTALLQGLADKNVLDVFNQEVGVRLFASLCKHIKRQRISVDGAVKLISDLNHYHSWVQSLHLKPLIPYFNALRELAQIYLIDMSHAKQMAAIIADTSRFGGIFRAEEVYEYAERREDWFRVKKEVERAMYGFGLCAVM